MYFQQRDRIMLILDKNAAAGCVWCGTGKGLLSRRQRPWLSVESLGAWIAAIAVLIAGYDNLLSPVFQGYAAVLPQSYHRARVIHSLLFHMRYAFASFWQSTASFLRARYAS